MARASSSLHHTVLYCCLCCKYKVLQLKQIKRTGKHHCLKTVIACHSRYLSFIEGRVSGIVVCVLRLCRMICFLFSAGRDLAFHTPFSTASCGESTNWPHLPLTPEKRELDIFEHAGEVGSLRFEVCLVCTPHSQLHQAVP